jgi:CHAT domain-containing protein/tetratricopeptide (TPR) repeat protein
MFAQPLRLLCLTVALACLPATHQPEGEGAPARGASGDRLKQRAQQRERYVKEFERLTREGKLAAAFAVAEKFLDIEREALGSEHPRVLSLLGLLSQGYLDLQDFASARKARREIVRALGKLHGEKHWKVTDARSDLVYVERVARLTPAQRQRLAEAHKLSRAAVRLAKKGEFRAALAQGQKSARALGELLGEDTAHAASALQNLAEVYILMGAFGQAELHLRRTLEVQRKALGADHPQYARVQRDLGLLRMAAADYRGAEPLLRQAAASHRAALGENSLTYAISLHNLSLALFQLGEVREAVQTQERALGVFRKAPGTTKAQLAEALGNYGGFLLAGSDLAAAERCLREAAELHKGLGGETGPGYLGAQNTLAVLYLKKGDVARAEGLARETLRRCKAVPGGSPRGQLTSLTNLATVLIFKDPAEYAEAEQLYRESLPLRKRVEGEDHPMYALTLANLANVCQLQQRPREAFPLFEEALRVEQTNLERVFGAAAEGGMQAYLAQVASFGRLDALLSATAVGPRPGPGAVKAALTWTLRRKGMLFTALARFREAQRLVDLDPALAERVARWRTLRRRLSDLPLRPPPGVGPQAVEELRAGLRKEAAELEAALHRDLTDRRPDHFGAAPAVDADRVRQALPPGAALVEMVHVSFRDFQARRGQDFLKPDRYFAFVFPAGKGGEPRLVDLGEARAIDEAVGEFRRTLSRAGRAVRTAADEQEEEAEARAAGTQLYRLVFAPLQKFLGPARLVYLAPDGELNRLPFGALPDEHGKYLIETYSFAYLCSGRDLLRPPAVGKGSGTAVFAGPDFDLGAGARQETAARVLRGLPHKPAAPSYVSRAPDLAGGLWRRLPGAAAESQVVRAALGKTAYGPVRVYLGSEALEEVFKAMRAPRILHVATHGFYLPDPDGPAGAGDGRSPRDPALAGGTGPDNALLALGRVKDPLLRSGLCLAGANVVRDGGAAEDGWLTAEEISLLDLRGTELVVLSACVTGLGDVRTGEGVYGLRRAFLHAGARTLVTSLFSVPDQETRELMQAFYAALRAGKSRLEALHTAQREIIRQRRGSRRAAHPFFWASFVSVGDPS